MAEWINKEGFGSIFTNDKKGNDKAPDRKGEIMLGGVVWELAGWIKEGAKGKYMSISGKVKGEKPAPKPAPKQDEVDPFDSDLPF